MTVAEYREKLERQIEQLRKDNRPLFLAAQATHARMSKRIFSDGKDSSDGSIGVYSEKDIWIDPDKTATRNKKGFNPLKGKSGNTKFKSNPERERKTSYFEGWKGFRETQGLRTGVVNLNYVGDMFSDFNRPVQIVNPNEYVSSFSRELNSLKASGNEEHFGKTIFKLTQAEKDKFFKTAEKELKLIFGL